ncbi:MAG TPA: hypothetical protein VGB05_10705 [Pyrinomonadaceae bacterium]|jgi:hypothetical protein
MRDVLDKLQPGQAVLFTFRKDQSPINRLDASDVIRQALPEVDTHYQRAVQECAFIRGFDGNRRAGIVNRGDRTEFTPDISELKEFEITPAVKVDMAPITNEHGEPIGGRFAHAARITISITIRRTK